MLWRLLLEQSGYHAFCHCDDFQYMESTWTEYIYQEMKNNIIRKKSFTWGIVFNSRKGFQFRVTPSPQKMKPVHAAIIIQRNISAGTLLSKCLHWCHHSKEYSFLQKLNTFKMSKHFILKYSFKMSLVVSSFKGILRGFPNEKLLPKDWLVDQLWKTIRVWWILWISYIFLVWFQQEIVPKSRSGRVLKEVVAPNLVVPFLHFQTLRQCGHALHIWLHKKITSPVLSK